MKRYKVKQYRDALLLDGKLLSLDGEPWKIAKKDVEANVTEDGILVFSVNIPPSTYDWKNENYFDDDEQDEQQEEDSTEDKKLGVGHKTIKFHKVTEYRDAVVIDDKPIRFVEDDVKVKKVKGRTCSVSMTIVTDDYEDRKRESYYENENKEKPGYKFSD